MRKGGNSKRELGRRRRSVHRLDQLDDDRTSMAQQDESDANTVSASGCST